jgi:hypothetical protein
VPPSETPSKVREGSLLHWAECTSIWPWVRRRTHQRRNARSSGDPPMPCTSTSRCVGRTASVSECVSRPTDCGGHGTSCDAKVLMLRLPVFALDNSPAPARAPATARARIGSLCPNSPQSARFFPLALSALSLLRPPIHLQHLLRENWSCGRGSGSPTPS